MKLRQLKQKGGTYQLAQIPGHKVNALMWKARSFGFFISTGPKEAHGVCKFVFEDSSFTFTVQLI